MRHSSLAVTEHHTHVSLGCIRKQSGAFSDTVDRKKSAASDRSCLKVWKQKSL
jgi:hypothetical protein